MGEKMKQGWTPIQVKRLMMSNGYSILRYSGDHMIYYKAGARKISIPVGNTNAALMHGVIKRNNLIM